MDERAWMWNWLKVRCNPLPPGFHVLRFTDREWAHYRMLPSFGLKKSFNPGWPGN